MHYQEITEHYILKGEGFSKKALVAPSFQSVAITRNLFKKRVRRRIEWQGINPVIFLLGLAKSA